MSCLLLVPRDTTRGDALPDGGRAAFAAAAAASAPAAGGCISKILAAAAAMTEAGSVMPSSAARSCTQREDSSRSVSGRRLASCMHEQVLDSGLLI